MFIMSHAIISTYLHIKDGGTCAAGGSRLLLPPSRSCFVSSLHSLRCSSATVVGVGCKRVGLEGILGCTGCGAGAGAEVGAGVGVGACIELYIFFGDRMSFCDSFNDLLNVIVLIMFTI